MVSTMETLTIRTENKFRTLTTKQAYKKGDVICTMPSENIMDKPNRFTVQIAKDKHTHVGKLAALNHSCDPNVVLDTEHMVMIARRDGAAQWPGRAWADGRKDRGCHGLPGRCGGRHRQCRPRDTEHAGRT